MAQAAPNTSSLDYFTGLAKVYAECRPGYPPEAIAALLDGIPHSGVVVADIGCGTGISTRLLASAGGGLRVIGIDPNDDMLKQARTASDVSSVEYRQGTGERTGLADSSVDVVVCAQSFHWFDAGAALRESHRILKPAAQGSGLLALIWNVRDDGDAFTAGYGEIVRRAQADAEQRGRNVGREHAADPTAGGWFGNRRTLVFPNVQRFDMNGMLGRIRSASYFPKEGNPLRNDLERDLRSLFDRMRRDGVVDLRYRTEVTLADRV